MLEMHVLKYQDRAKIPLIGPHQVHCEQILPEIHGLDSIIAY